MKKLFLTTVLFSLVYQVNAQQYATTGSNTFTGTQTFNGSINGNAEGGALRIQTTSGYLEIGPMNTGWSHFQTDRPNFYFNKSVYLDGKLSAYGGNNLCLQTNGVDRITVLNSNGNVGIGTTSPNAKLDVTGNAYLSNASIGRSGSHYDEFGYNIGFTTTNDTYTYRSNDPAASIRMGWNGNIEFRTAPLGIAGANMTLTERMRITLNGNVGIGITNPSQKLEVNGTIRAKEVKIESTGWPDYVFSPDYRLPSLETVSNHIKEHNHLPDIPSAQEVTEQGINLGEMQAKLLQKIEELTLYVIQQDNTIQELKKEITEMKETK